ncbi:MAG: hypothetical protein WCI51_09975 [Lentisphaerota bacterium]
MEGVLIPVNGKEWAALTLDFAAKKSSGYTLYTQADIEKQLARDTPGLKAVMAGFR